MKSKRIITTLIIAFIAIMIVLRLVANKQGFEEQLKTISEFNIIVPVDVDTAKYKQQTSDFSVYGSFQPFQEISVTSETQGKIVSVTAEVGDKVNAGKILAAVDDELLKSQFDLAKFDLERAEKDMQRFELLSKRDAATVQQYESAKQAFIYAKSAYSAASIQYENAFIKAPFNGIITKRYIENGSYLLPGAPVFDLVEINKVKFVTRLTSDEVENVKEGQPVDISVDAYPGIIFKGTINTIVVKADLSRCYEVGVLVMNRSDKFLKPGMSGKGLFAEHSDEKVLAIPRRAVTGSIKNPEVYIVKGDSVIRKGIKAVPLDDKYVEVREGLKAGDVVVVSGQINLVNGSKITLND